MLLVSSDLHITKSKLTGMKRHHAPNYHRVQFTVMMIELCEFVLLGLVFRFRGSRRKFLRTFGLVCLGGDNCSVLVHRRG